MREKRNLHLRVQELCDCYATNDPLKEMSKINREAEDEEAPLKWLALAVLHGLNDNAEKITLTGSEADGFRITATYRPAELPSPGGRLGARIVEAIREITHIEGAKGKIPLALGVRQDSIELQVKLKDKDGRRKVSLRFPR